MTATPPPPPPPIRQNQQEEKAHAVAWLVPVAAVLAVIGLFTPWFKPQLTTTFRGESATQDAVRDGLYSWKEGRLGLAAPIVLVLLAVGVISLLRGRNNTRFHRGSTSPVVNAARAAIIAGAVSIVAVIVAYFLLPSQYKFRDGGTNYSWDETIRYFESRGARGVELSQGPQLGFWLTAAGGVVAIVAGALMLALRTKQPSAPAAQVPAAGYTPPPPAGYGQQPPAGDGQQLPAGYGQPQAGYGQQPPPSGYGAQSPSGYGAQPPAAPPAPPQH